MTQHEKIVECDGGQICQGAMNKLGRSYFTFTCNIYMFLGHIDIACRDKNVTLSQILK